MDCIDTIHCMIGILIELNTADGSDRSGGRNRPPPATRCRRVVIPPVRAALPPLGLAWPALHRGPDSPPAQSESVPADAVRSSPCWRGRPSGRPSLWRHSPLATVSGFTRRGRRPRGCRSKKKAGTGRLTLRRLRRLRVPRRFPLRPRRRLRGLLRGQRRPCRRPSCRPSGPCRRPRWSLG